MAVVGGSGSGKSTLVRLVYRFFDVSSGSVLVGGQDVRSINLKSLRNFISVIPQVGICDLRIIFNFYFNYWTSSIVFFTFFFMDFMKIYWFY